MMNKIYVGTVKFFDNKKGYGFISVKDGRDVFLHVNQLYKNNYTIEEGQSVRFESKESKKGLEAYNVELI